MKINPNEPAMPYVYEKQSGMEQAQYFAAPGLTKLEWAAVQIMAGISANPSDYEGSTADGDAKCAVGRARALFAELEKQG